MTKEIGETDSEKAVPCWTVPRLGGESMSSHHLTIATAVHHKVNILLHCHCPLLSDILSNAAICPLRHLDTQKCTD